MSLICTLVLVLLGIGSGNVLADSLVHIRANQTVDLMNQGQIYPAQSQTFPTDSAQLLDWQKNKKPITFTQGDISPGRYWFYASLKNSTKITDFVVNPHNGALDIRAMGLYQAGQYHPQIEGFNQQYGYLRDYARQIKLVTDEHYMILILFERQFSFETAKLTVQPQFDYGRSAAIQNALILFCVGILLVVILYSSFVVIVTKDKSHFYFTMSAITLLCGWSYIFNIVDVFFGWSSNWLHWLLILLLPLMNGLFTIYFFNLKKYSTILSKLLLANSVAGVLFIPLLFYWPELGVLPAMLFNTIWLLLSSVACITAYYRGWRSATYFGFGLACLWCAISMVVMIQLGVIETFTDHQANILLFGCMINLLFMSYALVDRFTSIARKSALTSEQLEQSVQNRTAELQTLNQSLEQLAVQFQAANEAKNTFLVNMSHEIRTPLTAIIGYADGMLQGDINDTDKEQAIKVISQNGVHLLDIISDLLDISKIESNKLEIEMQPVDPLALCQGIESLVREQVQSKGLTMTINYQLPLPTQIISDPNRLRQVLLNIINNAIKFTHTGTIDISVHTDIDENKFFVSISDTGIGMSQSQIDGMFTAFRQEDLSISRQYGGAGLGLSIAKSLTTKLGGDIEVTSQQSQGSTFKVIIDLKVPKSTKWLHQQSALYQFLSGIEQQADEVESINLPALSGHVLLAEDHMDNQLLFIRLLERMGLKVTAVDNGYKAVQATLEREFELILLDIQMPEMDGLKAFELIQTTCANVPVIALTANAMPADVELYKKLGFNDHIAKPIDRQKFVDTITQYLNIERSGSFSMELDEMGEITAQFIARLVLRVGDIKVAQANKDWQEIGKHAHAIKGSAGMFGFDDLGLQGAALELAVKNGEQAICQDALDKLLQMCDAVTA